MSDARVRRCLRPVAGGRFKGRDPRMYVDIMKRLWWSPRRQQHVQDGPGFRAFFVAQLRIR
jgi:hypothetical protein